MLIPQQLSVAAQKALYEERDATIKQLKNRIRNLEAMGPLTFLQEGLHVQTITVPRLAQVLMRHQWTSIRYDAPNNHWYVSGDNYEKRVPETVVAEVLSVIAMKE
jgi:hypothetical protein